jgi:hypothetical protein
MELILGNEPSSSNISVFPNPVSPGSPLHINMPFEKAAVDVINSAGEFLSTRSIRIKYLPRTLRFWEILF